MIASSACLAPSELQPNHHRVGYFDSTSTTAATSASAANISINSSNNASNRSKMMTSKNDLFICQPEDDWRTTLPTPPRSPETSSSSNSIIDEEFKDNVLDDIICDVDALGILEGIDFDPMVEDLMANTNWGASLTHSSPAGGNGTSDLRHDCMWSGTCDDSCKQRMRYPSENSDIHLLTPASSPLRSSLGQVPSVASASSSSRRSTSSTVSATSHHHDEQLKSNGILHEDHSVVVSEFVDPSAVMYTPHADHSYFLTDAEQAAESGAQMTVVPSSRATATAGKTAWPTENYVLSDTPSESDDDSDDSDSNADDEEEIDVVSVHSAAPAVQTTSSSSSVQHVRAHQRSLNSHTASSQRSLLKSKNSLRTAHHKQRKQQRSSTAGSTASSSSASTPATPYLLTPVQSPQPQSLGGPVEYPMPKVTSSGRVVQPTNRSASFLESQPQHATRGDSHRKRKRNAETSSRRGEAKQSRHSAASGRTADVEDPEKRKEHNSMERKRRDGLRFAFQRLRELVPDIKDNPKAAKVVILSKAAEYSRRLQTQQKQLEVQMRIEASRKRKLERTLLALQQQANCTSSSSTHASLSSSLLA